MRGYRRLFRGALPYDVSTVIPQKLCAGRACENAGQVKNADPVKWPFGRIGMCHKREFTDGGRKEKFLFGIT